MAEVEHAGNVAENQPPKIFITGADHGAGLALVYLAVRAGYQVVGTTDKGTSGSARIRNAGGIPVPADVTRAGEMRSAMNIIHCDVAVNCYPQVLLGMPQAAVDYDDLAETALKATEAIVTAAAQAGVKRLIHISPAYLYGDTHGHAVTEDAAIKRSKGLLSKLAQAEDAVFDGGIPGYVLRSALIYGGWHESSAAIATALARSGSLPKGSTQTAWIHEDDLAAAVLTMIELSTDDEDVANIFNVADNTPASGDDMLAAISRGFGTGEPSGLLDFLMGSRTSDVQKKLLSQSTLLNTSKLQSLGWQPTLNHAAGVERTLLVWRIKDANESLHVTNGKALATT